MKEYHVLPILQEAHGGQFVDLALVDGGLEGEIEIVQGLLDRKAGHLNLLLVSPFRDYPKVCVNLQCGVE